MPLLAAKRVCSILAGVLLAGTSALAQTPQERGWCEGEDGVTVDQRIDGCSAVIKAARDKGDKLAEAFNNRGVGYRLKSDYERALADYNQAIKLNAKFAAAYNNRGVAYDKKGEYDRALFWITSRRSSSSRRLKVTSTAATPSSARVTTITPSTTTTRRSSSRRISRPPSTTGAGRARWSESSNRRSPTATKRSA